MEEGESVSKLSRKELRKQRLMAYLAAKGRLKLATPKPCIPEECQDKEPVMSALKVLIEKENEVPADRSSSKNTKVPAQAARSAMHPGKRALGVSNSVKFESNIQTRQPKTNCQAETTRKARPERSDNPAVKKRSAVASSEPNLSTISRFQKQSKPGIKSYAGRPSSSTAVTKSDVRFSTNTNAALSRSMKTDSDRISIGPLIRTKTGLTPAIIQPRRTQSQIHARTSATRADSTSVATNSTANKVRPSTSNAASASKGFALAQRKTLAVTALNNPGKQTGVKIQAKSVSKPPIGQLSQVSCKRQESIGLRTTSKCTAASNKPQGRVGMSKIKSVGLPTESTKQKSQKEREKTGQRSTVTQRPSSGPTGRGSSRAVSGVVRAGVVEPRRPIKLHTETDSGKERSSAVAPQTAPRPSRAISRADTKTTKIHARTVPQAEGQKGTAAQEERMRKLKEWQESKGISYKRPPMPLKPPVRRTLAACRPVWATMKEEDEASSLIRAVDSSLADCIKLLGEGCTPGQVKAILSRLPAVSQKFVKYWICRARLMEQEGNLDVLPLFEEAVGVVLEPVDELRTVVFEILKKKDELQESDKPEEEDQIPGGERTPDSMNNPLMTPKPVRTIVCGEKGTSSVVKYKITATPGGPPGQQREPARVDGKEIRFFTPVRRSVRIEKASRRYPVSLQDHDLCVSSYNELISKEDESRREERRGVELETGPSTDGSPTYVYVYRENDALKDKVFVQLVDDEALSL